MSIHDDNPTSTPTDEWGLEPLMDIQERASYPGARELVNPATAALLDRAFAKDQD
jgi:hypothetical protein